jgi:hypothetical protein
MVLHKGRAFSDNIYPTNTYVVGIKIFKLCDENGYTCGMTAYLGRERQTANCATSDCNSRHSVETDKENTRKWPQTCDHFLVFYLSLLLARLIR